MNSSQQMRDPAAGVPPQLLPHMHLVSKQRYPQTNTPSLENIVGYLLEAPKILNELQSVQWQLLECPADGTILLVWQAPDVGANFASDGYIWNESEVMFNSDVRGYNLQMYLHRAGFRPGTDMVACHSRRRYRLTPSPQNLGADPSIWIVHYSKAQQRDHVPAASVPLSPQTHAQMQQRRLIFSQGALPRKDFMLRDRASWPTITAPAAFGRPGSGVSGGPGPAATHRRGPSLGMPEPTVEEEEDVSRGDALDFMSPRDVSRMRYEQHHEWMEEILESPYRTLSIIPPELGLGRKGELETLTKGFFEAPIAIYESSHNYPAKVGRMDPGKAQEFTALANQRLADMQAELDKMRQAHQKRMEKLRKSTTLGIAEKRLRALHVDASRSKGSLNAQASLETSDGLEEIAREVEESVGKKINPIRSIHMVQKGGFQPDLSPQVSTSAEKEASQPTRSISGSEDGPADQSDGSPAQSKPEQASDAAMTGQQIPAQEHANSAGEESTKNGAGDMLGDVDMEGVDDQALNDVPNAEGGDWVMVDDHDLNIGDNGDDGDDLSGDVFDSNDQTPGGGDLTAPPGAADVHVPAQQQRQNDDNTAQHQDVQSSGQTPLDTVDFDLGNDFDNTAGDALADFNAADELGLDTMDDSAFGDAFPPQD